MTDRWTFGWTQLLTIIGFVITVGIAVGGFRTFSRWRREKLEETKIQVALDGLSIAYECKYVFAHIRSAFASSQEWADMPERPGEEPHKRNTRGAYYAIWKRITANKDFFDRAFKLQPRFMAVFGRDAEDTFLLLHKARREIEVAVEMLTWQSDQEGGGDQQLYRQLRADIWEGTGAQAEEGDRVGRKLAEFQSGIETLCRPVVDRGHRAASAGRVSGIVSKVLAKVRKS